MGRLLPITRAASRCSTSRWAKAVDPGQIVKARALHQLIHDLAGWLPRLGLVREACQLLDVAQQMEHDHPVGRDAITEYDHLFENGYQAIVRCLVASADGVGRVRATAAVVRRGGDLDSAADIRQSRTRC